VCPAGDGSNRRERFVHVARGHELCMSDSRPTSTPAEPDTGAPVDPGLPHEPVLPEHREGGGGAAPDRHRGPSEAATADVEERQRDGEDGEQGRPPEDAPAY
jgi:hypothetical protein